MGLVFDLRVPSSELKRFYTVTKHLISHHL